MQINAIICSLLNSFIRMKTTFVTLSFLLSTCLALAAGNCYSLDTEIGSTLLNSEDTRTESEVECQAFCTTVPTSSYFTFTEDDYPVEAERGACYCYANSANSQMAEGRISGPNYCGDFNICCDKIALVSSGGILNSEQSHVIGNYSTFSLADGGHMNYRQDGEDGSFLYYYEPVGRWYVGVAIGINAAYSTNGGVANCGEKIGKFWDYWSPSDNEWIVDETMTTYCI